MLDAGSCLRVLVVYKKSFLEAHGADRRVMAHLGAVDRARLRRSDAENRRTIADVTAFLARRGVRAEAVDRGSLAARRRYDLVISVGGDGTFFATARWLRETPLLGINSDPANSLGLWTCADRATFRPALERALEGRLGAVRLNRMGIAVNGAPLRALALNDVLFAHRNPAAMTRYRIEVDGRREVQRSSGVWAATAAGSTAAIRSAGAPRMPITSRRLRYATREPYGWPQRVRLSAGVCDRLTLEALGVDCAIWIDGSRLRHDLDLGDRVELRTGAGPLTVLGYDDRRRRRLFP